tara:strand:+ start:165 stop:872 length:708 start_codon:yes stop_codon:yes gene_type:complete
MKYILKNSNHGKEIYVIYDDVNLIFSKITFFKQNRHIIENEIKGINWYNSISPKIKILSTHSSDLYSKLTTKKINGFKFNYFDRISKNYLAINNFIDYYSSYYPKDINNLSPIHGDLTLDNIIFDKNNIVIIDWENFDQNGHYWGYDLIYLILSTFFLPILSGKKNNMQDNKVIINLWKKIKNLDLSYNIMKDPIHYFLNCPTNNSKIMNKNYRKFFFNLLSESQIKNFYDLINN